MKKELTQTLNHLITFDQTHLNHLLTTDPIEREKIELIRKHLRELNELLYQVTQNKLTAEQESDIFQDAVEELEICNKIYQKPAKRLQGIDVVHTFLGKLKLKLFGKLINKEIIDYGVGFSAKWLSYTYRGNDFATYKIFNK